MTSPMSSKAGAADGDEKACYKDTDGECTKERQYSLHKSRDTHDLTSQKLLLTCTARHPSRFRLLRRPALKPFYTSASLRQSSIGDSVLARCDLVALAAPFVAPPTKLHYNFVARVKQ